MPDNFAMFQSSHSIKIYVIVMLMKLDVYADISWLEVKSLIRSSGTAGFLPPMEGCKSLMLYREDNFELSNSILRCCML